MAPRPFALLDHGLLALALCLLTWGLVSVFSSSLPIADTRLHQPYYFFSRQLQYATLGLFLMAILVHIPLSYWLRASRLVFVLALALLVLVLVPKIGHVVNGSMRWIRIAGWGFQPSEFMKLAIVIYMAGFLLRNPVDAKHRLSAFLIPMWVLATVALLLLVEPDFGSVFVITVTVIVMLYMAKIPLKPFVVLGAIIAIVLAILAFSSPYRLSRLTAFLNPWADQYASGYQLTQSLMAFGRGGIGGVGLGQGIQKWFYLPEAHTDFIFAVLAEELGLWGVTILMSLFVYWVLRILWWARQASLQKKWFAAYLAYGLSMYFGIQAFCSMGVNMGVLPTKGLALPFFSYGGSNLIMNLCAVGLLLRISYECRSTQGLRR